MPSVGRLFRGHFRYCIDASMANDTNSRELVQRLRDGQELAATELFDRYVLRLVQLVQKRISQKLASRFEADDIVQSTYRSFFLRVQDDQFVFQRSGDLWRLLASIAIAKLRKKAAFHRAAKRDYQRELPELLPEMVQNEQPAPDHEVALLDLVQQVMQDGSERERAILQHRLRGDSIQEIAKQQQRSERTVRRILSEIQSRLEDELFDE